MAFSAGFHPHPRISYANAAPTGSASEAEYFEILLAERVDPTSLRQALDDALPRGLDIVEVVEAAPGALADRLQASEWEIRFRDVAQSDVEEAVAAFLRCEQVEVTRMFRTGPRTFDVRGPTLLARVVPGPERGCAILRTVVRHTTPSVRPDDLLTALRTVASFAPRVPPLVTRMAQGPLGGDDVTTVTDPLAIEKEAAGS